MAYYTTHEIDGERRAVIFEHMEQLLRSGEIYENQRHRMLGRYFGYPECCIASFINNGLGGLFDCPELGMHWQCEVCYAKD